MFQLVLTVCLLGSPDCDDHVLDSFDTMEECKYERAAFIVDSNVSPHESAMLSCKQLTEL